MPLPLVLPGAHRRRSPGVDDRHARHLVRRHLPGPDELLRATSRSSPEPFLQMYPEFKLPPEQMKAWLADRTGRHRRRAISRSGSAGRSATAFRSRATICRSRSSGDAWEFNIDGIYDGADGRRQDAVLLPLRLPRREPAASATGQVGWYVVKIDDPSQAAADGADARRDVRQLVGRDEDDDREGVHRGFAKQIGDIGAIMIAIARRRAVHDPAGRRQHDGAVGARADQRAGGAQDARASPTAGSCAGARRVAAHRGPRRRRSGWRVAWLDRRSAAIRPAACCRRFVLPAARPRDRRRR